MARKQAETASQTVESPHPATQEAAPPKKSWKQWRPKQRPSGQIAGELFTIEAMSLMHLLSATSAARVSGVDETAMYQCLQDGGLKNTIEPLEFLRRKTLIENPPDLRNPNAARNSRKWRLTEEGRLLAEEATAWLEERAAAEQEDAATVLANIEKDAKGCEDREIEARERRKKEREERLAREAEG